MSLISRVIRSLINGVSQQAPSVRLDNQVEEQVNMIPDISGVLTRRNPVILDDIITQDGSRVYSEEHAMFDMTIDGQKVVIGIKPDGTVYRFDEGFETSEIKQPDSVKTYLSYTDKDDLQAIETSDRLIILNRDVTVQVDIEGYTLFNASLKADLTSTRDITEWSSPMDACYIVGIDDPAGGTAGDFQDGHTLSGKVVVWNSDHTKFSIYKEDTIPYSNKIANSPSNSLMKRANMLREDLTGNMAYPQSMIDTDVNLPDYIIVDVNFETSPDNIRIPPVSNVTATGSWNFRVEKSATDSFPNDIFYDIGNQSETGGETLPGLTYGSWGPTVDTLDLTGYVKSFNGVDYAPIFIEEVGSFRYYGWSVILDKNKPSFLSGLPVKIQATNDKQNIAWVVRDVDSPIYNTEDYTYDVSTNYVKVNYNAGVFNQMTSIDLKHPDSVDKTIDAFNNQFPTGDMFDLGSLTVNYSDDERILTGFCVETDGSSYNKYVTIRQEVLNTSTNGLAGIGNHEESYDSLLDAIDVTEYNKLTGLPFSTMDTSQYIRGDFQYSIDVMNGKVDYYNVYTKTNSSTTSRSLIWVTNSTVDAIYTVTRVGVDGSRNVLATITALTETPKSLMTRINTAIDASLLALTLDHDTYQENNTLIVRCENMDYLEVDCDYGEFIHTIAEARLLSEKTLVDPTTLPVKIRTDALDSLTNAGLDYTNFLVRVNPDVNNPINTYYLRYSEDYDAWVEDKADIIKAINLETMPVNIRKNTTAQLDLEHTNYKTPKAGDDFSNLLPSFVGKKLKDLVLFNSRLGYASEDTLVFSVINDYFNLFRTTTSTYLVSDVVDLKLDSSKLGYSKIDNVFTLDNKVFVNTGLSQSALAIPQNLDISGAIFTQVSSFDLGNNIPIPVRNSMYFPVTQGSYSTIKAFGADVVSGSGYTDNPATKHCQSYINGRIVQSVYTNDVFIARTDSDKKTLYVQHTYVSDGTILQNAWHKWVFKYDIKYIYPSGDVLKIVFEDTSNTQTLYGSIDLNPIEVTEDTDTQIGYNPYLDFQTADTVLGALLSDVLSVDTELGKLVPAGSANSIQGNTYISSVTLSEIIPKRVDKNGQQTKLGYAKLMLRRMSITLGFSGRLNISVDKTGRSTNTLNFIPKVVGNVIIGREPVTTRHAKFPVNGRSQDVTVTIATADTFTPMQVISVEWQGQLITQGGR